MFEFNITNLNMQFDGMEISRIVVSFNGRDLNDNFYLSGNMPVTFEEYQNNMGIEALRTLIKDKVVERITDEAEETTTDNEAQLLSAPTTQARTEATTTNEPTTNRSNRSN